MPKDKAKVRSQVADEILSTERTYVTQLDALIQVYINPLTASLQSKRPILKQKYIDVLFRNVAHIRGIHQTFMADIKKQDNPKEHFGEIFCRFAHFFKMYTDYVNEHERASNALAYLYRASKYDSFVNFCKRANEHPTTGGLNLASLLITPIQRIPRYKLLLSELVKNTDDDHPDKEKLQEAIEIISETAKHINEAVRAFQNRKAIQECMDEFVGGGLNLLEPHRKFIRKGELIRQTRNKTRTFMFYLFNDLLIYASPRGWKYRVHLKAPIDSQFKIEVYGQGKKHHFKHCSAKLKKTAKALKESNGSEYPEMFIWQIISRKKSFIVFAPNEDLGQGWVKDLQKCKEDLKNTIFGKQMEALVQLETAPVWQPDSEARACTRCQKSFGFIRRRHHCRKCGLLVCGDCSRGRAILSWCPQDGKQRVCDKCGQLLEEAAQRGGSFVSAAGSAQFSQQLSTQQLSRGQLSTLNSTTKNASKSPMSRSRVGESSMLASSQLSNTNSPASEASPRPPTPPSRPLKSAMRKTTSSEGAAPPPPPHAKPAPPPPSARTATATSTTITTSASTVEPAPPAAKKKTKPFSILRFATEDGGGDEKARSSNSTPHSAEASTPEVICGGEYHDIVSEARERTLTGEVSADALTNYVWAPHSEHGFVAAKLVSLNLDEDEATFRTVDGEQILLKSKDAKGLRVAGSQVRDGDIEDLTMLTNKDFSEGSLLHIVRSRYKRDLIYTTLGGILVAVNPLRILNIYTMDTLNMYASALPHELSTSLPPHVFTVAAEAFHGLTNDLVDQSVVISGESGSGKTETTKLILQYISEVADSTSGVEQELLQSNPLLEAFGNAKTVRNDNSSRFGKMLAITVQMPSARISGGAIKHYLLEKTRVIVSMKGERNYHIFYQLCAFANKNIKEFKQQSKWLQHLRKMVDTLQVRPATHYHYTNQGSAGPVRGFDDAQEFLHTMEAMDHCGMNTSITQNVLALLTAVLHLGNIKFENNLDDATEVRDECAADLVKAASLLQVDQKDLRFALENRTIKGKDNKKTTIPLSQKDAREARDALAKAIYSGIFDFLVLSINTSLKKHTDAHKTQHGSGEERHLNIFVLDIFGFEVFSHNSLEQFFINYANEKLQQFFNQFVFKSEQVLYLDEGLQVQSVTFKDNQDCLNLIEGAPGKKWGGKVPSILKIMDECGRMPNPTDQKLLQRIVDTHNLITSTTSKNKNANPHFDIPRKSKNNKRPSFIIKHYSGDVTYSVDGFLSKNQDHVHLSLKDLLRGSGSGIMNELFPMEDEEGDGGGDSKAKGKKKPLTLVEKAKLKEKAFKKATIRKSTKKHQKAVHTLGSQFKSSIRSLIGSLRETTPHFIRCIKPNSHKRAYHFDAQTVLRQMRNGGLVDAIRIRRLGFPYRKGHAQFVSRYASVNHTYETNTKLNTKLDTKLNTKLKKRARHPADAADGFYDVKSSCASLLSAVWELGKVTDTFDNSAIQMGKTKVFWTNKARRMLETWRQDGQRDSTMTLQAAFRAVLGSQALATNIREESQRAKMPRNISMPPMIDMSGISTERLPQLDGGSPQLDGGKPQLSEAHMGFSAASLMSETEDAPPSLPAASRGSFNSTTSTTALPPLDKALSSRSLASIKEEESIVGREEDLYISVVKTKHLHSLRSLPELAMESEYLRGLFLNRSNARKNRFHFQKSSIPNAMLKSPSNYLTDKVLAKSEHKIFRKKSLSTFENILRYMKVKFHAYPITTGFAVVSTGHSDPAMRDEIFAQLIKQTTETPKPEWQILGFKLIYLCLSAFMPEKISACLLSHIAMYANPMFESKLPDVATTVQQVATHCIRLFIANRQMQQMELKSVAGDMNKSSHVGKVKGPYYSRESIEDLEDGGTRLYVTLELVQRVTRGQMVECDDNDIDEDFDEE